MMPDLTLAVTALRPFIPAKDFEVSKRFYLDLGFTLSHDGQGVAEFEIGQYSFLLQNYYEETWAKNCMMHLVVNDLDCWWKHIESLKLTQKYEIEVPAAPKLQAWGLSVAYLHDPSGVLWHIVEEPSTAKPA